MSLFVQAHPEPQILHVHVFDLHSDRRTDEMRTNRPSSRSTSQTAASIVPQSGEKKDRRSVSGEIVQEAILLDEAGRSGVIYRILAVSAILCDERAG